MKCSCGIKLKTIDQLNEEDVNSLFLSGFLGDLDRATAESIKTELARSRLKIERDTDSRKEKKGLFCENENHVCLRFEEDKQS